MPAFLCSSVTVGLKPGASWHEAHFVSMLAVIVWHAVHALAFDCRAIAGCERISPRACAEEIGAGAYDCAKTTPATIERTATAAKPQTKTEKGQGRTRSRVGVQLKRALPRTRIGFCGRRGDVRCIFPASRLRFSQKTLSACAISVSSSSGFGAGSCACGASPRLSVSATVVATSSVTLRLSASLSRVMLRKYGPI